MENLNNARAVRFPLEAVFVRMHLPSLMADGSDDMKSCGLMRRGANEDEIMTIHHWRNHCLFLQF